MVLIEYHNLDQSVTKFINPVSMTTDTPNPPINEKYNPETILLLKRKALESLLYMVSPHAW